MKTLTTDQVEKRAQMIWFVFALLILGFGWLNDREIHSENILFNCFLWIVVTTVIGYALGKIRAREWTGALLGLLLGPLGWLLVFGAADGRERCAECLGVVHREAKRCRHCGNQLAQ